MTKTITRINSEKLAAQVIVGIQEKKGIDIVKIDLRDMNNSIADFFLICHATSTRQVDAIADSVIEVVRSNAGDRPNSIEGKRNSEWVLIDYVDVVVHVFLEQTRAIYALEELWADAQIMKISA